MKLIVGLGNPGEKYEGTRHNVGFMVVDKIVGDTLWAESKSARLLYAWKNYSGKRVEFIKPQTFMNESGSAATAAYKKHPDLDLGDLFVIYDDLDIKLGDYKIVKGKGPREHMGLLDIYKKLGSSDFWHVRVGVDNRLSENRIPGDKYVLQDFTDEEGEIIEKTVDQVLNKLISLVVS